MASECSGFFRAYGLVTGVLSIIVSSWGLWEAYSKLSERNKLLEMKRILFGVEGVSEDYTNEKTGVLVLAVGLLINVVASLLLLLGIVKQCHKLLWPWLITNALLICSATIYFFIHCGKGGLSTPKILLHVGGLFLLCFLYFLMYFVYKETQGSRGGGGGYFGSRSPRVVTTQSQSMTVY